MTPKSEDEQNTRLNLTQKIEILGLLANRTKIEDIAKKYVTNAKAIFRTKKEALAFSPAMKATLSEEVQEYLTYYEGGQKKIAGLFPKDGSNSSQITEEHANDLANCAKDLVIRLRTYKEEADKEEWPAETLIREILENLEEEDLDDIEFFNKKITRGLLAHLSKSEFITDLETLQSWFDLEVGTITDDFLKMIRLEAALKEFKGKCELCP